MAVRLQAKASFMANARATLASPTALATQLGQRPLPPDLRDWLARLQLLKGVPFNYLLPDERLLPPESIRFFTLDPVWVATLIDGAMSIGRTLSAPQQLPWAPLEAATAAHAAPLALAGTPELRAKALGIASAAPPAGTISGFLLRSSVVTDTPGLGANVYPQGNTPADHDRDPTIDIVMLDILRFEALGPASDVLICLVAGDAYQVDLHQPPEQLHYGLDAVAPEAPSKNIHSFTVANGVVTLGSDFITLPVANAFRADGRVANMATLAGLIGQKLGVTIDAAEMGFEMIEGVGTVSFIKGL